MDITMSRVRLASDTCDIYFTYTKVNHLLYTCSLDPFEDGILLDTPLVCMHERSMEATMEEEDGDSSQDPDIRPRPRTSGPWNLTHSSRPTAKYHQRPDIRRQPRTSGVSPKPGHPALPPEIRHRQQKAPEVWPLQPGHPAPPEAPGIRPPARTSAPARAQPGQRPMYPFPTYPFVAYYIYSFPSS